MNRSENVGSLLKRAIISAAGVALGSWLVPGIHYDTGWDLFWVVIVFGILTSIIKPILVLFTLPFVFLTLGLGLLLINAVLYLLVGEIVPGFWVDGFWDACLGALIVSALNGIFYGWVNKGKTRISFSATGSSGRRGGVKRGPRRIRKDDDVIDI